MGEALSLCNCRGHRALKILEAQDAELAAELEVILTASNQICDLCPRRFHGATARRDWIEHMVRVHGWISGKGWDKKPLPRWERVE